MPPISQSCSRKSDATSGSHLPSDRGITTCFQVGTSLTPETHLPPTPLVWILLFSQIGGWGSIGIDSLDRKVLNRVFKTVEGDPHFSIPLGSRGSPLIGALDLQEGLEPPVLPVDI